MPLYEYQCDACGNHFEEQQKLADAPLVTCPKCGKDALHKVISATAFHLKGGGWYKDLYSSSKPGAETTTSASPKPSSSDSASSGSSSSGGSSSSSSESAPSSAPVATPSTSTGSSDKS